MISFKQFLKENELRRDNPGGEWLKTKQKYAEEDYPRQKGYNTSITGYYKKPLKLKTKHISNLPGARGEEAYRDSGPKMKEFEKQVGHPSKFNTKKNPILIGVNQRGESHVIEGNHRLAYANKHGIPHVHADVRYYAGGEDKHGPMHPDKIKKMKANNE